MNKRITEVLTKTNTKEITIDLPRATVRYYFNDSGDLCYGEEGDIRVGFRKWTRIDIHNHIHSILLKKLYKLERYGTS